MVSQLFKEINQFISGRLPLFLWLSISPAHGLESPPMQDELRPSQAEGRSLCPCGTRPGCCSPVPAGKARAAPRQPRACSGDTSSASENTSMVQRELGWPGEQRSQEACLQQALPGCVGRQQSRGQCCEHQCVVSSARQPTRSRGCPCTNAAGGHGTCMPSSPSRSLQQRGHSHPAPPGRAGSRPEMFQSIFSV